MAPFFGLLAALCTTSTISTGAALPVDAAPESRHAALVNRQLPSAYAPLRVSCPSTSLNRAADGIASAESKYVAARRPKADAALSAWLRKVSPDFDSTRTPLLALTTSGGGYRALLNGAGVVQGLDSRDSNLGTSGVFQGLTYYAGLSGGGWLLSSLAANDWPTVSSLRDTLWSDAFQDSALVPEGAFAGLAYAAIVNDIAAKEAAAFDATLVDPYGRLVSYQLLKGMDGGVVNRLSGLASKRNFTSHNVPFPIMTAVGVETFQGQCIPRFNSTQYEFTPYEFGSWDAGVRAFTNAAYIGTKLTANKPTDSRQCTLNYDNLGYVFGTSSDIFGAVCGIVLPDDNTLEGQLQQIISRDRPPAFQDTYGVYTNPFYKNTASPLVQAETQLNLADGALSNQNNPIWPLIQPERAVDVLIVTDVSSDTEDNFPNGTAIRNTYIRAQQVGLTKMPAIPPATTFVSEGLNKRAVFFGCDDADVVTIVWLPNVAYSFMSNTATLKLQYSKAETAGIIANGVNIASQNGDQGWPTCLACAIQKKTGTALPAACDACFDKYCYRGAI